MPYTTLISTDTLATGLDSDAVIVDCRYNLADDQWGAAQYRASHIPGAVYASLSHHLATAATGSNGRHPLPSIPAMSERFGQLGIRAGVQVIAYDQDTGMFASRLWWMLRYLGHDAVAVLDGGFAKWVREQRPTRSGEEAAHPTAFDASPRHHWRLSIADVEQAVDNPATLLVDARGPERFEGRTEPIDRVAGHIPGAANHYYQNNVAPDGTMLPPEVLKNQFEPLLNGPSADHIVMYCGSGVSACHNILALEHAGITGARLYPGSWSEWSADPGRPVETGPARKK